MMIIIITTTTTTIIVNLTDIITIITLGGPRGWGWLAAGLPGRGLLRLVSYPSIHLSIYPSINLSINLTNLSIFLPLSLYVCVYIYIYTHTLHPWSMARNMRYTNHEP